MKTEVIGKFYIINGELKTRSDDKVFERIKKPSIYEVLRVVDGVPLFLEDHLNRMKESAYAINFKMERTTEKIKEDIRNLISKSQIENNNIKLLASDIEGLGQVVLIYFIESFYPPKEYYEKGIHTILFPHERENPNAKVQMTEFRKAVEKELKEKNAFEALLVNKDGYIPEGSRSNMFFVKGEKIYTGSNEDVLLGITRKYILEVCKKLNLKIIEENIHVDDLNKIDGGFMSGTSVNVLPISTIDNISLDSVNNKIIKTINNDYVNIMENYISERKN